MLIDITRPLSARTVVWPGDLATEIRRVATREGSCLVNVNELHISLHAATHLDAPFHYDNAGATIDELDLSLFIGPATVLKFQGCPALISPAELEAARGRLPVHPRVLLGTGGWRDSNLFPTDFPVLTEGSVAWLADHGVKLLGVDVPSVDAYPAKTLPIHDALNRAGILILESLDLSSVEAGAYELFALPLNLPGAEASPVRAVLRR